MRSGVESARKMRPCAFSNRHEVRESTTLLRVADSAGDCRPNPYGAMKKEESSGIRKNRDREIR